MKKVLHFQKKCDIITKSQDIRPIGQAVKTLASHAGNSGSIPGWVTINNLNRIIRFRLFFFFYPHSKWVRSFFIFAVGVDGGLCRERLLTRAGSVIGCSAKRQQESPSGLDVLALLCLSHHTPERLVSRVPWNK